MALTLDGECSVLSVLTTKWSEHDFGCSLRPLAESLPSVYGWHRQTVQYRTGKSTIARRCALDINECSRMCLERVSCLGHENDELHPELGENHSKLTEWSKTWHDKQPDKLTPWESCALQCGEYRTYRTVNDSSAGPIFGGERHKEVYLDHSALTKGTNPAT